MGVWSNNGFGDRGWLAIALVIFTTPEGKTIETNLKVRESDIELVRNLAGSAR